MRVSAHRYFIGRGFVCIYCLIILTVFLPQGAFAAPAFEGLFELKQPNGIKFRARSRGDEWNNWVETDKGYGIYLNRSSSFWEYYLPSSRNGIGRKPSPPAGGTNAIVGVDNPAALGIPKGLHPPHKPLPSEPQSSSKPNGALGSPLQAAVSGTKYVLIIAVDYDDQPATYSATTDVEPMAFGASSSVADYFNDVSYSSVTISPPSETSGTANDGVIGWLRIGTTHPNPCSGFSQQTSKDAIEAADAYIDFSAYDSDSNGTLDPSELSIMVVVAGYERAFSVTDPSVWAHKWSMSSVGYPVVDGVTIQEYAQVGEIHTNHFATFGVVAHEFGHLLLDLPDLYDTNSGNGTSYGIGYFGLMGTGNWGADFGADAGSTPVHLSAWSKEYLGWGTVTTLSSAQTVNFPKVDGNAASIFRVDTSDSNQYFLIENRETSGYDVGLKGLVGSSDFGGLAIYHIDDSVITACISSGCVNADEDDKGVDVEEGYEGTWGSSWLDTRASAFEVGMLFSEFYNDSFGDSTTPDSKLKDGTSTGILFSNISDYADTMTADFDPDDVSVQVIPTLNEWGAILMVLSFITVYFMHEKKFRI